MNDNYTIGVEEEYMICNPLDGNLVDKADIIMDNIPNNLKNRFSYELILSEIESNTKICNNVNEAITEIHKNRLFLNNLGEKYDFAIGLSGTHPTAKSMEQSFVKNDSYNWVSEQLKYYATRNITFSTHIHIGIKDPENIIKVTNSLRRWISPMLALSVNSPFFEGVLTGMHSSRTFQFSTFPRTNIAGHIKDLKSYEKLLKLYKQSNSIAKDRQVWWKIRPHIEYGTVEFRVCDVQLSLQNTAMLISLVQALVHAIIEKKDFDNDYNYEILQDGLWKSARFGIDTLVIDPLDEHVITMKKMIENMLDYCSDSLDFFETKDNTEIIYEVFDSGPESYKQLDFYKSHDFDGLKKYLIDNNNW